jgi:hypothetical protein
VNRCAESERVQSFLDGDLAGHDLRAFLEHAGGCALCASELALYRRVVRSLETLPLIDPGPAFTARVLDRVLPSRVRRRWLRTLGLGYASGISVTLAGALVLATQPAARTLLVTLAGETPRRIAQALIFLLNALSFSVLSIAEGGRLLEGVGQRLAPLARAISALLSHTSIGVPLSVAVAACVVLLWWMRPREHTSRKEIGHVGVLGF